MNRTFIHPIRHRCYKMQPSYCCRRKTLDRKMTDQVAFIDLVRPVWSVIFRSCFLSVRASSDTFCSCRVAVTSDKKVMFYLASVSLSACMYVCLSVCLSVCLPVCLSMCMSVFLSVCLSICMSVCLPVCLSVYLSVSNFS